MPINQGTRDFISERLNSSGTQVSWISDGVVKVEREKYPPFNAALIAEARVEKKHITPIVTEDTNVKFIANFPRDGFWTGAAIELAEENGSGWGRFGTLMRALNKEDVAATRDQDIEFSTRIIRQHSNVKNIKCIYDRVYDVFLNSGKRFRVSLINEYDLTAEAIRATMDRYGEFDHVLHTNPNGRTTTNAAEAAEAMGIETFNFRDYLRYLGKK